MAHQRNTDRFNACLYFFFVIIIRDSNPTGATVVRQSGGLSNRERVEPTEKGGETIPARAPSGAKRWGVPYGAP